MNPVLSQEHLYADLFRILVATVAIWLAALVARLGWVKYRRTGTFREGTHWSLYAALALAMVLVAVLRVERLQQDVTFDLWLSVAVVAATAWGVLRSTRFHWPHRHWKHLRRPR